MPSSCALVAGAVADRLKFSAFLLFSVFWLFLVYVPSAHWVWGGGFLAKMGVIDFAGGTVVHINAGVAGLLAALMLGARQGYGKENLAPFDLSMAVIGTEVVGVAGPLGMGHVLLFGDEWIEFDSEWSTMPPIPQLWLNVVTWLSPDVPVLPACD